MDTQVPLLLDLARRMAGCAGARRSEPRLVSGIKGNVRSYSRNLNACMLPIVHINQEGMALDEAYVAELNEKPPPDSLKAVQRLVGALNWCRDHCVGFADKMHPIYEVINHASEQAHRWLARHRFELHLTEAAKRPELSKPRSS